MPGKTCFDIALRDGYAVSGCYAWKQVDHESPKLKTRVQHCYYVKWVWVLISVNLNICSEDILVENHFQSHLVIWL